MNIARNLAVAVMMTIVTTIVFGLAYPLAMTAVAQIVFLEKANGQLVERGGRVIGSRIVGQSFSSAGYFHGRPSAAGSGYDGASSSGTNLGPTSRKLAETVKAAVEAAKKDNRDAPVPIDLVTASASGLDPHLSPAAAAFQAPRVARARGAAEADVRALIDAHVEGRQFGVLGEPRVNVLLLNLALDERWPPKK